MTALCRLIHAEKVNYPVVLLCRTLHVTRSSYYAWREGEAARQARQAADDALAHEITALHIASRKTYGGPRIHAERRRLGRRVNRKRIARALREHDIRGVTRRERRSLTRPDAKGKPAPDLIGRDFHAERPKRPWVLTVLATPAICGSCEDRGR
ncbi:IS3 family transposase [Streptomyces sp. NPDC006261]|uniref:IS3 family transposase n=1 Tax=Streptomyces sp. NPDC006261 TaxID=3156739 RepID=UPI0033AB743B